MQIDLNINNHELNHAQEQRISQAETLGNKEFLFDQEVIEKQAVIDRVEADRILRSILEISKVEALRVESKKNFGPENDSSPVFLEAKGLSALAELVRQQRGDLMGDDRSELIQMGADEKAMLVDCRYLKVETKCETNKRRADKIWPPNVPVKFAQLGNAKFKPYIEGGFTRVNYATLVVRDNENGQVEIIGGITGLPMTLSEINEDLNSRKLTIDDFRQEYCDKVIEVKKKNFKENKVNFFVSLSDKLFNI